MKKTFKIPVTWAMVGLVEVEAETLEEAIESVGRRKTFPKDESYVGDSYEIQYDFIDDYNEDLLD